jgi:hypothetical protein
MAGGLAAKINCFRSSGSPHGRVASRTLKFFLG